MPDITKEENIDDILKELNVPWITDDGFLDLAKFPIDSTLEQAIGGNEEDFRSSCRTLTSMFLAGRAEVIVFLYGLLVFYEEDIYRKEAVVDALGHVKTRKTADMLFREMQNTDSSNTTRRYINTVLKNLTRFPPEYVREGFEALLNDRKWSYRMKKKFKDILEEIEYRSYG